MTAIEMIAGRTQVSAEGAVGKTVESVAWDLFYCDTILIVFFTDGTFLHLRVGMDQGVPHLSDTATPEVAS